MEYARNEDGSYQLYSDGEPLCGPFPEIAIFYEVSDRMWTLHKHGPADLVKQDHDRFIACYSPAVAQSLGLAPGRFKYLTGDLNLEELNRAIATSGYVKTMVEKHHAVDVDAVQVSPTETGPRPTPSA